MYDNLLDYAARMARKSVATAADIAMYQPRSSGGYDFKFDGEIIPLASKRILGPPRAEDLIRTAAAPPFWNLEANQPVLPPNVPDVVDHRPNQTPVKQQGDRATCVAFAALAQLEAKIKAAENRVVDLSEQYAHWLFMNIDARNQCDEMVLTTDAAAYLKINGVCEEGLFPYEVRDVVALHCNEGPSSQAKGGAIYGIKNYKIISSMGAYNITNLDYLEAIVGGGEDIVVGLEMALVRPDDDGIFDAWLDVGGRPVSLSRSDETPGNAPGHAMLLVGYDRRGPKPFFILKNCWGEARGDNGYFYLTYDYFKTYAKVGYMITEVRTDMPVNV